MNMMTILVLALVVILIIGAIFGTRATMRDEKCCGGDKNCTCCETKRCSIRKENKAEGPIVPKDHE
jgi:hypothetical protein